MKIYKLAAVLAAVFFIACGGSVPKEIRDAAKAPNGSVRLSQAVNQTTPAGARVFGFDRLTDGQLASIDAGIIAAARDGAISNYYAATSPAFYEIYTPPGKCSLSPQSRTPSFLVRADDYDGSEFDQYNSRGVDVLDGTGVIYASEMVLSLGTPGSTLNIGQMYVCSDESVLADAVRNGAEHIIIANNDSDYYAITWFHGGGFYHPLLPKRAAPFAATPAGSGRAIDPVK